ncbi:MAG: acylphosphatase [Planctomycetota bacterium]|nr:acylphosphatase [Planctomycetota bacterium]MDI6787405.1 acylphosphatase [Planctomycetota bacterium]
MTDKVVCAHLYISGRVQGVFFRSYTQEKALSLGIKGWVRNLSDRRVEAVFEGKETAVQDMIQWCHHGPPSATVTKVDISWEENKGSHRLHRFIGFSIR